MALTLAAVLDRSRPLLPLRAMLLLALPVVSSLQFYLGCPLRAFTAWASAAALGGFGMSVLPAGAALQWQGQTVLVGAPCSGVHMLWVGMFLTTALSHLQRARAPRLALNLAVGFIVVLLGNVLRNTLLFLKEARIVHLQEWTHVATGLGAFMLTAVVIATVVRRVGPPRVVEEGGGIAWSCFAARKDGKVLRVCERIYDVDGKGWTDVSAWYWAALLRRTQGPWIAVTTAAPR